jgi:hypothetical protein
MRNLFSTAILAGALMAVPAMGFAASQATASSAKPAAKATIANHSTTGTVKSVDATSLVIAHSGKKADEMTFTLGPSTQKEGNVAVGSSVSVRYHDEGGAHVASAIVAKAAKQPAAAKMPKKK